jgi:hypothetical protein
MGDGRRQKPHDDACVKIWAVVLGIRCDAMRGDVGRLRKLDDFNGSVHGQEFQMVRELYFRSSCEGTCNSQKFRWQNFKHALFERPVIMDLGGIVSRRDGKSADCEWRKGRDLDRRYGSRGGGEITQPQWWFFSISRTEYSRCIDAVSCLETEETLSASCTTGTQ